LTDPFVQIVGEIIILVLADLRFREAIKQAVLIETQAFILYII